MWFAFNGKSINSTKGHIQWKLSPRSLFYLISQFPSPEATTTTNFLCIRLERFHACANVAPSIFSMRSEWIFLMDSWVCHSLSSLPRTQRTETFVLQPHWPALRSCLGTFAHGFGTWPLHLGALSPCFAQPNSFRSSFTYHFLREAFLTSVSKLSPSLSSQHSQITLEHFLNLCLYICLCDYVFNVPLLLDHELPEGRDPSVLDSKGTRCPAQQCSSYWGNEWSPD